MLNKLNPSLKLMIFNISGQKYDFQECFFRIFYKSFLPAKADSPLLDIHQRLQVEVIQFIAIYRAEKHLIVR